MTAGNDRPSEPSLGSGGRTVDLPADEVPQIAPLALVAAGKRPRPVDSSGTLSSTTAAQAMRDEEIDRTRLFIRMGWVLSVLVMGTVPFVDAPVAMSVVLVAGLVIGMIVSYGYHRAFADPVNYTERALVVLAVICTVNGNIGVMYYGAFSAAPLMMVVGIHFVARTEAERVARWILVCALICYAAIAAVIVGGVVEDPGVFASGRDVGPGPLIAGTVFVLGTYVLAYETARAFRLVSLAAIEDLQQATRLASEREALMDELRADLERALGVGGPGRYTDQTVGPCRLGIVLGRGAIGEVYEAVDNETGAEVAVKLLRRELLTDDVQVTRFLREAAASEAISSPHVARLLGSGRRDIDGLPYLVVERLRGHTLAEQLRRESRLCPEALVELCRHAGEGIDAAAAAGIVHRDLKPQNLMRHAEDWKILDFGVATFSDDGGALTRGEAIGTPHFMAPEQAQGKPVSPAADRYALGAITYRCLTGRHAFSGPETAALLYAVVHRMPRRPSDLVELPPRIAHDVDRWCAIALAKAPSDRFDSGLEMAIALEAAFAGELAAGLRDRADRLIRKSPWGMA